MTRAALWVFVSVALAGCLNTRIQREVSPILRCPEGDIQVVQREPKTYEAIGCGRSAICRSPDVEGADLICAGGAPIRELGTRAARQQQ